MRAASGLKVATVLAALGGATSSELQAGRFCGDPVESGLSSGATQEDALNAAVQWWSSRAGAMGRGYESWDNAEDRGMECSQSDAGSFQCKATGRPCLPAGVLPENVPKLDM